MKEKIGIYRIVNKVNGKMYYGSTCKTFAVRRCHHIFKLRNNCHRNKHLQNAWNKYGESAFLFEWVQDTSIQDCISVENKYLKWISECRNNGCDIFYNICEDATASRIGLKNSPEHCARISAGKKGKSLPPFTDIRKEKIGKIIRNNPKRIDNTSGFKGVAWDKNRNKWMACLNVDKKRKTLGRFNTIKEAVLAYNTAAYQYYGSDVYLNKVV